MVERLTPDICVIGGGSGGLSVAAGAAAFGVSVVLVERGKMGGDCLNHGCVPSKALIAAAKRAQAMRDSDAFGIAPVEPEIDFRRVARHVHGVIEAIAPNDSVERFTALGVKIVKESARFIDARTVVAGGFEIRPRRFVIATGSSPAVPPIPGLDDVEYLTNETVFALTRRPSRLIVIGGGPVGLELAQAYRRLGSQVTVVEAATTLGNEDPEMAAVVVQRLRREGVDLRQNARVSGVERHGRSGVRVHVEDADGGARQVDGSHLLVATGRRANVDDLGLEEAGVAFTPAGIAVDARLRTSNKRIYAIGDVTGGPQFTHVAGHHAGIVLRSILFRLRAREDRTILPRVTFTGPELAHVGLTEAEARKTHRRLRILRWPYAENDRAQAERVTEGHVKLVANRRGRILGVTIVGAQAGELIAIWALALAKRLKLRDMTGYVPPYPTLGEIGKRAAISYFAGAATRSAVRRLVRFLRAFG